MEGSSDVAETRAHSEQVGLLKLAGQTLDLPPGRAMERTRGCHAGWSLLPPAALEIAWVTVWKTAVEKRPANISVFFIFRSAW